MRRQAAHQSDAVGVIPWPRRPAIAALTLLSLAASASAFTSLLWLGLDFLLNTGSALSGGDWWRDRLSLGVAAGLIAGATWLAAWTVLQRAAGVAPVPERTAPERRRLLGIVVLAGTLVALGFAVALLWTIFRALLGGGLDAGTYSRVLKDLSTIVVALAVAAYHGLILREERQLRVSRPKPLRVLALVAPGAEETLAQLGRLSGPRIEIVGYLSHNGIEAAADLAALNDQLLALEQQGSADGALLMLGPDGGRLYPYTKGLPQPAPSLPEPDRPARLATGETGTAHP
jgi:hypothetical protein